MRLVSSGFRYWRSVPLIAGVLMLQTPSQADTVHTRTRSITEVADGIYVIRHQDTITGFPNGNTTVVIGAKEVLVVDSAYLASEARQDVEQIRKWTILPVRYLVNTHWHNDHTMGNGIYSEAFPGLTVVAQRETATMIRGYLGGWYARHRKERERLMKRVESGKDEDGKAISESQKKEDGDDLAGEEQLLSDHPDFQPTVPDTVFEKELKLDLGNRLVDIRYLGKGNTSGDAVVFLPAERILMAGDLVVHPVPFVCSGYPSEWALTLQKLIDLNPKAVIPGHGEVLQGTGYVKQVQGLLNTVVDAVREEFYVNGNALEQAFVQKAVEKKLDFEKLRRSFDGGDPDNLEQSEAIKSCLVKNAYFEERLR